MLLSRYSHGPALLLVLSAPLRHICLLQASVMLKSLEKILSASGLAKLEERQEAGVVHADIQAGSAPCYRAAFVLLEAKVKR